MAGPLKNDKHERIALLVANGQTSTEAYGCVYGIKTDPGPSARRLLRNALFCSRIEELKKAAAERSLEKTALSRAWVIESLMTVARRCMQVEAVTDRKGNETGVFEFDASGANRSLELLGREVGMFIERSVQTVWSGDVATLNASQLAQFKATLEAVAAEQAAAPAEPEPPTVQ